MPLDQNPVFRKAIAPWYDSETVCTVVIVLMTLVMLFGLVGIYVAQGNIEYRRHLWVPVLLVLMSTGVIISTVLRMVRRR